jgi:SAM-dependent methyltransferase
MSKTLLEIRNSINKEIFTDKEDDYILNYEEFFQTIKDTELNFLEIGINKGGSLLLWAEYFKKSKIYGVDANSGISNEFDQYIIKNNLEERIFPFLNSFIPDSSVSFNKRKEFFEKIFNNLMFDVILDDGAHTYTHTKGAFDVLFNDYLKPGGIYIIEDWGTSYFPDWVDGSESGDEGVAKIIKELYEEVALIDRLKGKKTPNIENYKSRIKSLTIRFGQLWIFKSN